MNQRRPLPRDLPSIDRLLGEAAVAPLLSLYPRAAVLAALRKSSDDLRRAVIDGAPAAPTDAAELTPAVVAGACSLLERQFRTGLVRVVNATGVILHTNLGRALLGDDAINAVARAASAYTNLELDLETGRRGRRAGALHDLICELSGAEDACVVNNNAASVLLILDTFARGREVIVSRSELIEIGAGFRLPEVLDRSGAILREVGATNKTYPRDYSQAVNERTAMLLKSHTSNYRLVGFVRQVTPAELVEVARAHNLPSVMDLGSGALVDLSRWGLPREPIVRECVEAGLDLVCFSGDKLCGGPQAGVIVGRKEAVRRCAMNPLMRALRCDKLTLAALEATLRVYRYEERIPHDVPVLRMLTSDLSALEADARALAQRVEQAIQGRAHVEVTAGKSLPGGGTLPGHELETWLVAVAPSAHETAMWVEQLRRASPPVIVRVEEGRLLLDVRTLRPGDADDIVAAAAHIARNA